VSTCRSRKILKLVKPSTVECGVKLEVKAVLRKREIYKITLSEIPG
jgi:hypothetical protein